MSGLFSTSELQCLHLAGNSITSFADIECMKELTALQELSFKDIHFENCPIVNQAGYRKYVIQRLDQVSIVTSECYTIEKSLAVLMY